jgi:phage terminase large subunit
MTTVRVELPPKLIPIFTGPARYRGSHGGRGSGKTRSFAKMTAVRGVMEASAGREGIILCAREFMNSLDESSMEEVKAAIRSEPFLKDFYEIGEKFIRSKCGRIRYAFAGLRHNLDSIKSKANILLCWVDEAESVSEGAWRKLIPTIREEGSELWVTWNPEDPESPTNKRFRNPVDDDAKIIEMNYTDNPWFPSVLESERQRDLRNRPLDYAHIWEGDFKTRHDARVFTNWRIDTFDSPADAVFRFGADWGFAVDPSVLVRGFLVGRTLYIDHEAYAVGCDTDFLPFLFGGTEDQELIRLNRQAWDQATPQQKAFWTGVPKSRDFRITADSARPETVNYMRRHGFPKIIPAIKGQGSIEDGISFLQSFDLVIHERCLNVAREVASYSYKVDRMTEEVLPMLEDKDNHTIDALRYALEGLRRAGASPKPALETKPVDRYAAKRDEYRYDDGGFY